jgi:hypothetical protein
VRRDDETLRARLQPSQIIERAYPIRFGREVQQEHVLGSDRPFDAGNQGQSPLARIGCRVLVLELTIVQRDRDCVEAQRDGPVDRVERRVRQAIQRILGRMDVQIDLQHSLRSHPRRA